MTQGPEPKAAPTPSPSAAPSPSRAEPSRAEPSPSVASSVEAAPSPAEPDAPDDAPAVEPAPAPAPAPAEATLSDVVCESKGYGKAARASWLAAQDDLLACGQLQTSSTSCILNVSIWHAKPRFGGGPLPGHSAAIGTGGEEASDAAVQCLDELATRLEEQLSPAKLPARADCHARFERG